MPSTEVATYGVLGDTISLIIASKATSLSPYKSEGSDTVGRVRGGTGISTGGVPKISVAT